MKQKMKNFQVLYQTVYALWLLTYNEEVAGKCGETKLISTLIEILRSVSRVKVVRMALATLRVTFFFFSPSKESP